MLRRLFLAIAIALPFAAGASEPTVLTWQDLVPKAPPVENPFEKLDPEVLEDLGFVYRTRLDLKEGFIEEDSASWKEAVAVEKRLLRAGVDVEGLFAAADRMQAESARRDAMVDTSLAGKLVRMPGYALPLDPDTTGAREFLLVPYVGACIHTPPPPPNQIVYVEMGEPYEIKNLYEPVWITGTMSVEASSRKLSFVDGADMVETGYKLNALRIEPYTQP